MTTPEMDEEVASSFKPTRAKAMLAAISKTLKKTFIISLSMITRQDLKDIWLTRLGWPTTRTVRTNWRRGAGLRLTDCGMRSIERWDNFIVAATTQRVDPTV
ncbi:uncharacterized protein H6S33_010918 [Morchella sextelata]|uniref:uncharacterized protein n=1 Tax=Morchella sextelata TaxID=1174677 RepID=UPI001D05BB9F|nr:uncharacterized protein H6S33_010918 [Morchella sextelata]KAH0611653.1 hypothetical protein H6S33_010918 [Morchella sextelata]